MSEFRLGVDFGGVITASGAKGQDTFFDVDYLNTPSNIGCFEVLGGLNKTKFENGIWVISKASSAEIQSKTRHWLEHNRFFEATGVTRDRLLFTAKRAGKLVVAQSLGVTHFVDDTPDVLENMLGHIPHLYLLSHDEETTSMDITVLDNWQDLETRLLED